MLKTTTPEKSFIEFQEFFLVIYYLIKRLKIKLFFRK